MTKIYGTLKSVSKVQKFQGKIQVGFVLREKPNKWYNVLAEKEETLNELKKNILVKKNEISFEYSEDTKKVSGLTLENKTKEPNKQEEEMTTFEDLLSRAHEQFGEKMHIRTELLRDAAGEPMLEPEKKYCVFKAQVYIKRSDKNTQVFEAHGDSTAENIGKMVENHFIRMAETRAIVRALRFATNNAKVSKEEMGEVNKEKTQ